MALKGLMLKRFVFPSAAAVILVLLSFTCSFAAVGRISALSGSVYLKAKAAPKWKVAEKGAAVEVGDKVKTGSDGRASIEIEDGSRLSLGNDSELELTEFTLKKDKRSAVYSLSTGKLRAYVGKFTGKTDVKVKTPTSTSGIKGTDFIVMNQGDANVIFGEESDVEVSGNDTPLSSPLTKGGARGVTVGPGVMTENTRNAAPIEPVAVEPGSSLEDVRAQLEAITDVERPVEWEKAGRLPEILARWNINYGHYLADSRRFADSLDVFQIAIDLSSVAGVKAEAHLERGTVLSRNMSEPMRAISDYMSVLERYPVEPFLENAVFSAAVVNKELGEKKSALELFKRYLADYPRGSHRGTVDVLIRSLEAD